MASNQLLKKDLCEVFIKELGIRLWSAFLGKFPVALHLINELPLLNGAGVQRPQRRNWQEPKRGLHAPVEHHLFGSHRCQPRAGQRDARQAKCSTHCRGKRQWPDVKTQCQEAAFTSSHNRVRSSLSLRLLFLSSSSLLCYERFHRPCTSPTSEGSVPGVHFFIFSPFLHPIKQFSKRKAAGYQTEFQ